MTWLERNAMFLAVAVLSACSSSATSAGKSALPQAVRRAPAASQTQDPTVISLALTNCIAPTTCSTDAASGKSYIVFHGAAPTNATVKATPTETGYPYGYAVDTCVRKVEMIDGVDTPVGDQLSECRNVSGFIDALDNVSDPAFPNSTQTLEFFGDGLAKPSPNNPIYNSLSFPTYVNGQGLPQDQTYGFAVNLHIHDANGHFTILYLQWCPTASCLGL